MTMFHGVAIFFQKGYYAFLYKKRLCYKKILTRKKRNDTIYSHCLDMIAYNNMNGQANKKERKEKNKLMY